MIGNFTVGSLYELTKCKTNYRNVSQDELVMIAYQIEGSKQ